MFETVKILRSQADKAQNTADVYAKNATEHEENVVRNRSLAVEHSAHARELHRAADLLERDND